MKAARTILVAMAFGLGATTNSQPIIAQNSTDRCSEAAIAQYFNKNLSEFNDDNRSDWEPLVRCKEKSVLTLIRALRDSSEYSRIYAAVALGKIGKAAKDAAPALIVALRDPDNSVRYEATIALGEIGADIVPNLIIALKDASEDRGLGYQFLF